MLCIRGNEYRAPLCHARGGVLDGDFALSLEDMIYLSLLMAMDAEMASSWRTKGYPGAEV